MNALRATAHEIKTENEYNKLETMFERKPSVPFILWPE